jgi:hypothetical protein
MRIQLSLITAFILVTSISLHAQFNLTVAYDLTYTNADTHNEILQNHNTNLAYANEFKDLKYLNGVSLGARQAFEGVAFEFNLSTKIATKSAKDPVMSIGSDTQNRIKYGFNSASLGIEGMFGFFGIGTSIDFHLMHIKATFEDPNFTQKFNHHTFGNKYFMTFYLNGSGTTKLGIRPFAQFYWDAWDQGEIDQTLNNVEYAEKPESFNNFGISIIFMNGT